ncbi:hypothetical protein BKA62DRAFT_505381 [Auriculariales sp. MPI-PUGE-AT-0066]|nr:hypothetical protein BKA62DRAFT_505381 [Auriculariales sp. MPI-PUGE-AT-0066]
MTLVDVEHTSINMITTVYTPTATGACIHTRGRREGIAARRREACLQCRRRKISIKTLGLRARPAQRAGLPVTYVAGRSESCKNQDVQHLSAISALMAQIRALQDRLVVFEAHSTPTGQEEHRSVDECHPAAAIAAHNGYKPDIFSSEQDLHNEPVAHALDDASNDALIRSFTVHASRFYFPRATLKRLPTVSSALRLAILAIACRVTPSSLLPPGANLREHELAFVSRAEQSLSRRDANASALELVQTQALLANLMYVNARPLDGHRHAGGALRLATSLGLHRASMDSQSENDQEERAQTWWMVFALDRAWAGVFDTQSSSLDENAVCAPFPGATAAAIAGTSDFSARKLGMLCVPPMFGIVIPDTMQEQQEQLGETRVKVLALHARACELVAHATDGYPLSRIMTAGVGIGANPFTATLNALDRLLLSISTLPRNPMTSSIRVEAYAAIASLSVVQSNVDTAVRAARNALIEISSLSPDDIALMDPVVAFCLAKLQRAWRKGGGATSELVPLDNALERLGEQLPFTVPRSCSSGIGMRYLPAPSPLEMCRA